MKFKSPQIMLILMCFTMCNQKAQDENSIFVDLDNPENVSLFDYFRFIELIPLETSQDVLIADITKIILHQNIIYVLDQKQSIIFVFDQKGEFLLKIDKKGQGPGEYSSVQDININPFSGNLEILEPYGSLHIYDLSGNYIETKRVTYDGFHAVHGFAIAANNIHLFYTRFDPKKFIYFNLDEKKLLREEFTENREISRLLGAKSLYQYQDEWYIFRPIHPVVYKVGQEKLEVAFQFNFGAYTKEGKTGTFSDESRSNWSKYLEEVFAQFPYSMNTVRHNSKYVLALLSWKDLNRMANVIYDNSAGESKFILNFKEKVRFEPDILTDDYVLANCNWGDLKKYITKEMLDDTQKKIFEELVQSEDETNPILIKYWFK